VLVTHVRYYRQEAPRRAPRCATKALFLFYFYFILFYFILFFIFLFFLPAGSPLLRDTGGRSRL
jgi:Na+/proline symporter